MKDLLYRLISQWSKDNTPLQVQSGEVVSVDGNTCVVKLDEGVELHDVRLQAIAVNVTHHLLITPKVKSHVLIQIIENNPADATVIKTSEIETIEAVIGDQSFVMDNKGIVFNLGKNGGLTITPELVIQLQKMTARIDGIINAIKNAVATPQDGGVGLQKTMTASLKKLVDVEDFSNIENEKIKH